ncbi:putative ribonuclease H-like domain-containing protein [Tanacetum coccineum]
MTKNMKEHSLFSSVQQRTNHKDFQNCLFACFLSQEPKKVIQAFKDPSWIEDVQDDLLQFKLQKVWTLVDLPNGKRAIGTKWVYRNKEDERGIVIKNKARLVAQGYTQEEGIDYDEIFALVARIKAIRLFLAYSSFKDFMVYQMDVKSAFLYGKIEEEVYVCQLPGFDDLDFPDRVYKVEKALYGLHQAPRVWYETSSTYLLENGFQRGQKDKTLFIKRDQGDIMIVQVYVDDIIFGSTKKKLCIEFEKMMHKKFQMSFIGELTFFLGLQEKQKEDGIFISQDKYVTEILKKIGFSDVKIATHPWKPISLCSKMQMVKIFQVNPKVSHLYAVKRIFRYLKGQPKLGLWYPKDSPFDLVAYTDSDYAGASLDRKSTIGGCQFLGCRLISWQCKKQTVVANSTTEAEYVAASSCCGQVLWIQNQLLDYGYNFMHTKIYIDNESTICIVKNPVFHSKTKHIEIRHHFIRDSNEKKLIQMIKIHTDKNVADLLTKAFDKGIGVNAGDSKLMLLDINLLLLEKVNAATHNLLLLVVS